MRIGLTSWASTIDALVDQAVHAEADGFSSLWYASGVTGGPAGGDGDRRPRHRAHRAGHGRAADVPLPSVAAGESGGAATAIHVRARGTSRFAHDPVGERRVVSSRRVLAGLIMSLLAAGCVAHPVGPARSVESYERKANTTAESALSAVE